MRHAVEARALRKRFQDEPAPALVRASFAVARGTRAAFVGPEASGKSTLLRILAGRVRATAGLVRVLGRDPFQDAPNLLPRVGWVPCDAAFPEGPSVRELAELVRRLGAGGDPLLFAQLCQIFGLEPNDRADRLPAPFRRLLSLALALQKSPALLLVDGRNGGDEDVEARFLDTAAQLAPPGSTLVFATRRLDHAIRNADQLILVRDGSIVDRVMPYNPAPSTEIQRQILDALPAALPTESSTPEVECTLRFVGNDQEPKERETARA